MKFNIKSTFSITDEQSYAASELVEGIHKNNKAQVLLGVTGSGKTFTIANVIHRTQLPTLLISHNKTLAGQLYQEMRDFFPQNAVSYFVSYYDYYQPEAYIPQSDTYIEKEAQINDLIDKLRLKATSNIMTRNDVIVVASVSCIYNIGSPVEYGNFILAINKGHVYNQKTMTQRLVELQYERSEFDFKRGTFRLRGNYLDIYPAYEDIVYRIASQDNKISSIEMRDPLTGKRLKKQEIDSIVIYPAKHYLIAQDVFASSEEKIRDDLRKESETLKKAGRLIEAERLIRKVSYDLEMMKEMGYVNGIENYSRYFDGRKPGDPPYSLLDYFRNRYGDQWLVVIDESHMTVPQIRGMHNGDRSRKETLIEYGFRLQAALDNRPLKFQEFYQRTPQTIYVSATPNEWEIEESEHRVIEQLVRPTGIVDPLVDIRPTEGDIDDLIKEIEITVTKRKQRVLVTTLTKRTAEDLTRFLVEKSIRAVYLHSDIKTLERTDILQKLRKKEYDVLVGVNLLREGLDLPEVGLVAILDGDKEGFLRSRTSLIQTMGRAARNVDGRIVMYADNVTRSIRAAIEEVSRRREYQIAYNEKHHITPRTIKKAIREEIIKTEYREKDVHVRISTSLDTIKSQNLTPFDRKKITSKLEKEMRKYAEELDFETAILIRDKVRELRGKS
ncbi:excinuclease ABC subunit B [Candidatus Roizmanbacteria bacterium RIFCSPHIGHO2_02_FULL_40_9]|uniref:UvrABC system protein B n=2 Tax=Candidatus Roizmaniibacteriota TaxID=1752723 RepID=A0A1F7IKC5_9BACT|nr:MAG: excinuclease ABC subunit B [Candidatus Roizmanbacteria bacterium RIFCSPHIGHO2_02_FULL_40_9]OGK43809.1 MAG: excinuclease ABC subunit B [Candidatus Roizmanbacteria bacterium RIFCSPLOWO2_01_FULL_38_11]